MASNNYNTNIVRFVIPGQDEVPGLKPFMAARWKEHQFHMLRLISHGLHANYEIKQYFSTFISGSRQLDGNWNGILGVLTRGEADLPYNPFTLTEEMTIAVNVSYHLFTDKVTFLTDKPTPLSKNEAVFRPFRFGVWLCLASFLIIVPFAFFILSNKTVDFQRILSNVFANLLGQQSLTFDERARSARYLLFAWLLAVVILSSSYKAVLLSVLLAPPSSTGIRDISDLSKASEDPEFKCFAPANENFKQVLLSSNVEAYKTVSACLERTEDIHEDESFRDTASKRAIIAGSAVLTGLESAFFVSEDSFFFRHRVFPYSKDFCCPKRLNEIIHRLSASGLIQKCVKDSIYFYKFFDEDFLSSVEEEPSSQIKIEDLSGAFVILISGWILAFATFVVEIIFKKTSGCRCFAH